MEERQRREEAKNKPLGEGGTKAPTSGFRPHTHSAPKERGQGLGTGAVVCSFFVNLSQ